MIATEQVTSADGTPIGYLRQGQGPGLVLVQGAMADVSAYRDLAAELATSFTVYSAERRGRGLSPHPYSQRHDLARDVDDLDAILHATEAGLVFGLSSGAVITLEAARTLDRVRAIAVYEPPFYPSGIDRDGIRRLSRDIESGDAPAALLEALRTAGTAPAVFRLLPHSIGRTLTAAALAVDDRRNHEGESLRQLLPSVRYDFHDVAQVDGRLETYGEINKPALLISGTKSPTFLRQAIRTLHHTIPDSIHVELEGLGHDGPWNNGSPTAVASAIRRHLAEPR
ncbi:Pimeloyl-ACP methyl ester carboxylesterase [Microlunatus sagamiharensis]|uniref:Pimeloyl-ACP methyl ester carboxylesterase n=1 Tax=Microlunatus sagamiharensis TaxID=546874 RepID=A0A1H2MRJ5_9ACTN|nr:alpha/beta hydrolase [Microlunatus sagamiharensis]SDU95136.1 Pimeloyl-ACP methyl ester carboxylesterase [Microlunatus sagamiharensis]